MRRLLTALLAALLLAGAACAGETPEYTNLADRESRAEFQKLLVACGIDAPERDAFLDAVGMTANAFQTMHLAGKTWRALDLAEGDAYAFQDQWNKQHPDFLGYNCRMTAFTLLKGHISVGQTIKQASSSLALDLAAADQAPVPLFTQEEKAAFQTLFASIPASRATDSAQHVDEIREYFKRHDIRFSDGPKLVTVYLHDEDPDEPGRYELFPGHTGVLIQGDKGLYFIEKLAFQMPYRWIRFDNKNQLAEYLKTTYASYQTDGLASMILMENDQPLI